MNLLVCVSTEMEGALLRAHVPLIVTGVGAVNAAYALTRYLDRNEVTGIVVCGIGGAYPGSGLGVGEVVCADSECYGDLGASSPDGFLDMRALGFPVIPGDAPIYNVVPLQIFPSSRRARFVTVNTCTGTDDAARALEARTGGAVESMEGAAIAHVAALAGIPVGEIRGVSNMVGNRDRSAWRVREAAVAAQEELIGWLFSAPGGSPAAGPNPRPH
jgi:futalosine hydrolase